MAAFKNLGDLIVRDRDLSKVAIIDLGGEETPCEYTFAELDAMTMGVARALSKRGLQRGDRVAILSMNRTEYLAAYFGIMRAGFVAVPVNYRFPRKTIHFIIEDSGAKLVFCDRGRRADCPAGSAGRGVRRRRRRWLRQPFSIRECSRPWCRSRPSRRCFSTHRVPRARQRAWCSRTRAISGWCETRLSAGLDRHRYLIAAPLYHMNALALAKLACAGPRHHRAAAALRGARLYRRDLRATTRPGSPPCRR